MQLVAHARRPNNRADVRQVGYSRDHAAAVRVSPTTVDSHGQPDETAAPEPLRAASSPCGRSAPLRGVSERVATLSRDPRRSAIARAWRRECLTLAFPADEGSYEALLAFSEGL